MKKVLVIALAMLILASGAIAGTLTQGLQDQMRTMRGTDEITVLVVLKEQVDVRSLTWELHDAKVSNDEQHRIVVSSLIDTARKSQGGLLTVLAGKTSTVRAVRAHWLVNSVLVATDVNTVHELVQHDDVDVIEANMVVELIQPILSDKAMDKDIAGIGITPGLQAIQADRVWSELGINGTGALVGILDTGVDGNHPALSARWRGNFADPAHSWFDAIGDGSTTPTDTHYHGTHVMGTITGLAPDDTIGVAPGAQWIASNVINQGAGGELDNDVIASLQFMADPDGDPGTTDDVPDVVQNSWGVNEGFSGYFDCDSRWWVAIDNCEAAGVVLTWSAGNEGPGGTSLRSPADRATDQYNAFSVGSTMPTAPYDISSFSSRGPSGCGGAFAMKPEISAPGSDIYSAEPGGGYQYLSGTSMAGPHVAGVVALMRSANPGLDVITIKQIIMDTAIDLGPVGEENTYGHGLINAYDAVLAVMSGFGSIEGYVTDASSGNPIAGAAVSATATGEMPRFGTTDASGFYRLMLPQGPWNFDYSAFGYLNGSQSVTIIEDAVVAGDMTLNLAPQATLSGQITLFDGLPADMATVTALGTPLPSVNADALGFYTIDVPMGGTYTFQARMNGYAGDRAEVTMSGNMTQDFFLDELRHEDFESGDFTVYPWFMSGEAPWTIDSVEKYEGDYSARSGVITHNQSSTMSVELDLAEGEFSFWYMVSTESNYDYLRFSIDGVEMDSWSGLLPWARATYPVAAGTHLFSWSYTKDGSVDTNADAVWVDFIGEPVYPSVSWDPTGMAETLAVGMVSEQFINLHNSGGLALNFSSSAHTTGPSLYLGDHREFGKTETDPREGISPVTGSGGPDTFGYWWTDSDDVGGPAFDWVEINGVGTPRSFTDDDNNTYPLSFTFNFYGENYSAVNVCSNGFVSFVDTSTDWGNDPIPSTVTPNMFVAPMWDDLNPSSGGQIYTYDDVANSRYIIQWDGVPYYGTSTFNTFQVILNSDGTIKTQYLNVVDRSSCTIGLENLGGDDGLSVVYNAAYLHNDLAIEFNFTPPPAPWVAVWPENGSVPAGGSGQVTVTFDATDTPFGLYEGYILIQTNDPANAEIVVPVVLVVTDEVANEDDQDVVPVKYVLYANYPNPFNPMTKIDFELRQPGMTRLAVYDLSGRLVRELKNEVLTASHHTVTWDGTNGQGQRVASGTYYLRLMSGDFQDVRKMTLVK